MVAGHTYHEYMCAHEGQRSILGVLLEPLTLDFTHWDIHVSLTRLSRLVREPRGSACLCLPIAGNASSSHNAMFFIQGPGINLGSHLSDKYFPDLVISPVPKL